MITLFKAVLFFLLSIYSGMLRYAVNTLAARRIKKDAPLGTTRLLLLTRHLNNIFSDMALLEEYITQQKI